MNFNKFAFVGRQIALVGEFLRRIRVLESGLQPSMKVIHIPHTTSKKKRKRNTENAPFN